jgi:hypothetical protein
VVRSVMLMLFRMDGAKPELDYTLWRDRGDNSVFRFIIQCV